MKVKLLSNGHLSGKVQFTQIIKYRNFKIHNSSFLSFQFSLSNQMNLSHNKRRRRKKRQEEVEETRNNNLFV